MKSQQTPHACLWAPTRVQSFSLMRCILIGKKLEVCLSRNAFKSCFKFLVWNSTICKTGAMWFILFTAATVMLFCNSPVAAWLVPRVNHEGGGRLSGSWRQPDHLHLTHSRKGTREHEAHWLLLCFTLLQCLLPLSHLPGWRSLNKPPNNSKMQ